LETLPLLFLIAASPLYHKTEPMLIATQQLVQKLPPLAPQICCHCPLIVICFLSQQNCCDARHQLIVAFQLKVFPDGQ